MDRCVFISYRGVERDFALKLQAKLLICGICAWVDAQQMMAGQKWPQALETAITDCTAMIPVVSPAYLEGQYTRSELNRAKQLNRPLIPVLLRTVPTRAWPIELQGIQPADFTLWDLKREFDEDAFQRLLSSVKNIDLSTIGGLPVPNQPVQSVERHKSQDLSISSPPAKPQGHKGAARARLASMAAANPVLKTVLDQLRTNCLGEATMEAVAAAGVSETDADIFFTRAARELPAATRGLLAIRVITLIDRMNVGYEALEWCLKNSDLADHVRTTIAGKLARLTKPQGDCARTWCLREAP